MNSKSFWLGTILILQSNEGLCSTSTTVIKRVRRKTLTIPQLLGADVSIPENISGDRNNWGEFGSAAVKTVKTQTTTVDDILGKNEKLSYISKGDFRSKRIDYLEQDMFERLLGFAGGSFSLSVSMSMPTGPAVPQPNPTSPSIPQPSPIIPTLPISKPIFGTTCESNPKCAELGLKGACCPTIDNVFLDCCSSKPQSSPVMAPTQTPSDGKEKKKNTPKGSTANPVAPKQTIPVAPPAITPSAPTPTTPVQVLSPAKSPQAPTPNEEKKKNIPKESSQTLPVAPSVLVPTTPVIAPAPSAPNQVLSPTTPVLTPSSSTSCSSNTMCAILALKGECCPTPQGIFLDCCSSISVVQDATMEPTTLGNLESPVGIDSENYSDTPSEASAMSLAPSGSTFEQVGDDRNTTIQGKCGISELERSDALITILRNISGSETLTDSASAPFKALYWVDQLDEALICASDSSALIQRYALAVFYFSLNGPSWNQSSQWLGSSTECKWYGVTCDSADKITGIVLKENNLTGTLPQEFFQLSGLTGLSLDHNGIVGTIPDAIGSLTRLQQLELDDNALVGSIPSAIYQISTLKALDLNTNSLIGPLSDAIGNYADLMVLQVENNKLTGEIPWYGLASLDRLRK
jgi:Leucine rich repeat/Leucine rich repeat N-terminal domain